MEIGLEAMDVDRNVQSVTKGRKLGGTDDQSTSAGKERLSCNCGWNRLCFVDTNLIFKIKAMQKKRKSTIRNLRMFQER